MAAAESEDHVAGGNATAAARIVRAIPAVCDAEPGLMTGAGLPFILGHGVLGS